MLSRPPDVSAQFPRKKYRTDSVATPDDLGVRRCVTQT